MTTSESDHSDEDFLMARYADGDVSAFRQLYDLYERRIYSFCFRYLGDADAAADAFQDVFVRVVDARHRYEGRGRFANWIFTVSRRVCLDKIRADRPTEASDSPAAQLQLRHDASFVERIVMRDEIEQFLAGLPSEQREVLLLNRYHGFTYREIAEMIDSSETAVKQKAYRAVQTIREAKTSRA